MRKKIKIHEISFLFCILVLTNCSSQNSKPDLNIKKTTSEIFIENSGKVHIKSKVNFTFSGSIASFYLHSRRFIDNISISVDGNEIDFKILNQPNLSEIVVELNGLDKNAFDIDYDIDLEKFNSKINFYSDRNQFYILPEINIFPRNKNSFKNIEYHIITSSNDYTYSNDSINKFINTNCPYVISGNFNIFKHDNIISYVPKDIDTNQEKLIEILSLINQSNKYFTKIFGESDLTSPLEVYFLKRRGGHGYSNGIILDQEYVSNSSDKNASMPFIAHEVAHFWWGTSITAESPSITEGLAEYSADLFMGNQNNISLANIYAKKNIEVEVTQIKPVNFNELTPFSDNYRSISYKKIPIILHELEFKLGKEKLIENLRRFYSITNKTNAFFSYQDLVNVFQNEGIKEEFNSDTGNQIQNWPDFYIKNVSNNSIEFSSENILFDEIVPVEIFSDKNEIIQDTLYFNEKNNSIKKQYQNNISKAIIDKDFNTNQSLLINDVWVNERIDLLDSKYPMFYEEKYYLFTNKLVEYLFNDKKININDITDKKNEEFLVKTKEKLKIVKTNGFNLLLNKKKRYFKIFVSFIYKDKHHVGYIDGYYTNVDDTIILKSLNRINI